MNDKKVIVTGATGFVGHTLVERLLQTGFSVAVVSRQSAPMVQKQLGAVSVIRWSAQEPFPTDGLSALEGAEAVVHLLGESIGTRWTTKKKQAIYDSRVQTSRWIMDAIESCTAKPRAMISASAIGYYGDRGDELLREESAPGNGFLAQVCRDWEAAILDRSIPHVRRAVTRNGLVLGADGGPLEKMLPPFKLGLGGSMGDGQQWMSWIHKQDLVDLILFLIRTPEAHGPFNAVSPEPVRNAEFTKTLAAAVGKSSFLPIPKTILKLSLGEMSSALLSSQRVSPEKVTKLGFVYTYPSLRQALEDIVGKMN